MFKAYGTLANGTKFDIEHGDVSELFKSICKLADAFGGLQGQASGPTGYSELDFYRLCPRTHGLMWAAHVGGHFYTTAGAATDVWDYDSRTPDPDLAFLLSIGG